jgi:nuclear protein localization family protein 4
MLLRLRSPDGMFRLTVEQDGTFGDLITQVPTGPCLGVPGSSG